MIKVQVSSLTAGDVIQVVGHPPQLVLCKEDERVTFLCLEEGEVHVVYYEKQKMLHYLEAWLRNPRDHVDRKSGRMRL